MKRLAFLSAMVAATLAAQTEQRRATITSTGTTDRGKCTIEVTVDGAAEVEIRGERGVIRTLSGQPARWVRFECNGRMPSNPADFRFSGVDGRGRQELVRDPRNTGAAVIHISDPSGGSEGYTFDIEWQGGYTYGSSAPLGGVYASDATAACESALRDRASQQFGARDARIRTSDVADTARRNREVLSGTVEVRRGNRWEPYNFSCSVNANNGRVRSVEITSAAADAGTYFPSLSGTADRSYSGDECRDSIAQRLRGDGYRNVQVDSLSTDSRGARRHRVFGTATAQRGGSRYDFDVACTVDANGNVRAVEANRR
jgi:hypothetical protein